MVLEDVRQRQRADAQAIVEQAAFGQRMQNERAEAAARPFLDGAVFRAVP